MKLFFLILLLTTYSNLFGFNGSRYKFKISKPGIYRIQIPSEYLEKDIEIGVFDYDANKLPSQKVNTNELVTFLSKSGTFGLGRVENKISKPILSLTSSYRLKKIYKYNLPVPAKGNFDHWFWEKIEEKIKLVEVHHPKSNLEIDTINIRLYSYSKNIQKVNVSINGNETIETIYGLGQKSLNLEMPSSEKIILEISSDSKNNIFLMDVELSNQNRISYEENCIKDIFFNKKFSCSNIEKLPLVDLIKVSCPKLKESKNDSSALMILYPKEFSFEASQLLKLIQKNSDFVTVNFKNTESIFNYYSAGNKSAKAIKKFIFDSGAKYVILVGDADSDEDSPNNIIPTFYFEQKENNARAATDYPYSFNTNYNEPEVSVYRLPFVERKNLTLYIQSVFRKKNNLNTFYTLDADNFCDEEGMKDLDVLFNSTSKISHFFHIGHGSYRRWSNPSFTYKNAKLISNLHLKTLSDLSCWTLDFANRKQKSLLEEILSTNKGPHFILGSSGFSYTNSYCAMSLTLKKLYLNLDWDFMQRLHLEEIELLKKGEITLNELFVINSIGLPVNSDL